MANGQIDACAAPPGRRLGLSRERVRQIEQRALAKLRSRAA
jgi:DNA-directed RNA polymerase sigma subunit (sigma70/sigma32)